MSEPKIEAGFVCEARIVSDIMLRMSLAVSGESLERIDQLVPAFWRDVAGAEEIIKIVASSQKKLGDKRHAAIFATLLRLTANEYLRSLGYEGEDFEHNIKFMMDVVMKKPVAFTVGDVPKGNFPEGPVRGKV